MGGDEAIVGQLFADQLKKVIRSIEGKISVLAANI